LSNTYLLDVFLPNGISVPGLTVNEVDLGEVGLLIGMDIITLGDFSITQANGTTKFSFRIPSVKDVDFVEEHNANKKPQPAIAKREPGRNAPCPCGSGKKYKQCHGKAK
ncbi:MAG: SEC-C metal-binding domain-containing protein, partial [Phycisphaerae bacterium]